MAHSINKDTDNNIYTFMSSMVTQVLEL